jgi:hypothetical protein
MKIRLPVSSKILKIITIVVLIVIVVAILIVFGKRRKQFENVQDIFGGEFELSELPQISEQYKLNSLKEFRSYNPCIFTIDDSTVSEDKKTKFKGKPFMVYRMCNFALCPGVKNTWDSSRRDKTKSFTVIENPDGELFIVTHKRVAKSDCEQGCEDARSFICKDKLYLVCNSPSAENCRREMHIMELDLNEFLLDGSENKTLGQSRQVDTNHHSRRNLRNRSARKHIVSLENRERKYIREVKPLSIKKLKYDVVEKSKDGENSSVSDSDGNKKKRDEKNWMPMVIDDKIYFVYSVNPHVVIEYIHGDNSEKYARCVKVVETMNPNLPMNLRGGSQILKATKWHPKFNTKVKINGENREIGKQSYVGEELYIGVLHTRDSTFEYSTYVYGFETSNPFRVKYITPAFVFGHSGDKSKRIQFASGMTRVYVNEIAYLYITYGENDCTSKLCVIKEEDVMRSLKPC